MFNDRCFLNRQSNKHIYIFLCCVLICDLLLWTKLPEQGEEGKEEDEDEYDYGVERVDITGEAAALDDLAKLITVQEVCTLSMLVFVLWWMLDMYCILSYQFIRHRTSVQLGAI